MKQQRSLKAVVSQPIPQDMVAARVELVFTHESLCNSSESRSLAHICTDKCIDIRRSVSSNF